MNSIITLTPQDREALKILCTAILIPLGVWIVRQVWALWTENRDARISKAIAAYAREIDTKLANYVTEEDLDMKLEQLQAHQDQLHKQNTDFLDTIRMEGTKREGMILGAIEAQAQERRADSTATREALGQVHRRVDELLIVQVKGDRRQS